MSHFVIGAIEGLPTQTDLRSAREDLLKIAHLHRMHLRYLDELPQTKCVHKIVEEQSIGIGKLDICFVLVRSPEDDTSDPLIEPGTVSEPLPIHQVSEEIGGFFKDAALRNPGSKFVLGITERYDCSFQELRATPDTIGSTLLDAYDADGFYWPLIIIRT